MSTKYQQLLSGCCLLTMLYTAVTPAYAETYDRVYNARTHHYVYVEKKTLWGSLSNFFHKPVVKNMAIGSAAGVGVAAIADHSLLRGGIAGAATGLGVHAVNRSHTMQRKPLLRRALDGGIIGTGVGIAAGTALLPAAVIGTGVGAAVHYIKTE